MRAKVHLPSTLRPFAGNEADLHVDLAGAAKVSDLLDHLADTHPDLEWRVRDEQGQLRPHVNVFVDATSIRQLQGQTTALTDGCEVTILPAVSGG